MKLVLWDESLILQYHTLFALVYITEYIITRCEVGRQFGGGGVGRKIRGDEMGPGSRWS
mgnify:CR=1 FL=1